MKIKLFVILVVILAVGTLLATQHTAITPATDTLGADVSWPNCSVPTPAASSWGVVGVTGGLDFHSNPCLVKETTWFTHFALYMNSGYPGSTSRQKFLAFPLTCATTNDTICPAYNYGYNAAVYALHQAALQGFHTNMWWLDVETENSWTTSINENRASLQGMIDAIQHNVLFTRLGIYSSPNQWATITGAWRNYLPVWVATGSLNIHTAMQACLAPSFTAGPTWLAQYTPSLDKNYPCDPTFPDSIYNH